MTETAEQQEKPPEMALLPSVAIALCPWAPMWSWKSFGPGRWRCEAESGFSRHYVVVVTDDQGRHGLAQQVVFFLGERYARQELEVFQGLFDTLAARHRDMRGWEEACHAGAPYSSPAGDCVWCTLPAVLHEQPTGDAPAHQVTHAQWASDPVRGSNLRRVYQGGMERLHTGSGVWL